MIYDHSLSYNLFTKIMGYGNLWSLNELEYPFKMLTEILIRSTTRLLTYTVSNGFDGSRVVAGTKLKLEFI